MSKMTKQILCLSAADIHGNEVQYEKIKRLVTEKGIDFVFLCGDLLPKTGGSWHLDNKIRTIKMQADFINDFFLNYLAELGKLATVYAIFGNDDFRSNYSLVAGAQIPNVHFLCGEVVKLPVEGQDLYVAGYPFVGVTPFLHKDWEKWDTQPGDIPHKIHRKDGYASANGEHFPVDFDADADRQATIRDDLKQLATLSDPQKTIYVFHEAPFDTPLDMVAPDNKYLKDGQVHVGSLAIREFIEQWQPLVTMHGHIHETFDESGDYKWQSGKSLSVTAANDFSQDELAYVLFSLPTPSYVERLHA